MSKPIRTKPIPTCDECGSMMVLRRPEPEKDWEPFWGCGNYPDCRFTLNIGEDGRPDRDTFSWDAEKVNEQD
jgi:ssDNA-binding Zn-finger/Zn-ribbon topoisomerase 1